MANDVLSYAHAKTRAASLETGNRRIAVPGFAARVLELQRQAGNQAVAQLLSGDGDAVVQRCGPTPCGCSAEERAAAGDAGASAMTVSRSGAEATGSCGGVTCPTPEQLGLLPVDPHIPGGGLCRGACGPDCPDTCRAEPALAIDVTDSSGTCHATCHYSRLKCGTHQGCRDHDACFDVCETHGESGLGGPGHPCHNKCNSRCISKWGVSDCNDWRKGNSPYDGFLIFHDFIREDSPAPGPGDYEESGHPTPRTPSNGPARSLPAGALPIQRASLGRRTLKAVLQNKTTQPLNLADAGLRHGDWSQQPPETIPAGDQGIWVVDPGKVHGTEGVVEYTVDDNGDPAHFQWSTGEFIGRDREDAYAPDGYQASVKPPGAQDREAVVSFVITDAKQAGLPGEVRGGASCSPQFLLSQVGKTPQDELSAWEELTGILSTPLFKKHGISGWVDTGCNAHGSGVIHQSGHSTDGFYTIDVELSSLQIDKLDGQVNGRYIRLEVPPGFPAHERCAKSELGRGTAIEFGGPLKWDTDGPWLEIHPQDDLALSSPDPATRPKPAPLPTPTPTG